MDLLDHYAAAALQGLLANTNVAGGGEHADTIAKAAWSIAAMMLEHRDDAFLARRQHTGEKNA